MAAKKLVYFDRFINPVGEDALKRHSDEVEMVKLNSQDPKDKLWEAMADAHGFYTLGRSMPDTEEMIQKRKSSFCLFINEQGELELKKNHNYYYLQN